jgi:hypothetical protein
MRRRNAVLIPLLIWVSASLCLHLLSYLATTEVAERAERDRLRLAGARAGAGQHTALPPSEIEFTYVPSPPSASTPPPPTPDTVAEQERARTPVELRPEPRRPERPRPPPRIARVQPVPTPPTPRTPVTPPVTPPLPVPVTPAPPRPPQPPRPPPRMQYVDQNNQNNEPTPEDPAFLAQSNNNVREQTVAATRNLNRNDPQPQVGGSPSQNRGERLGNGERDVSADERDRDGDPNHVPSSAPNPGPRGANSSRTASATPPPGTVANDPHAGGAQAGRAGRAGRAGEVGTAGAPGAASNTATPATPGAMTSEHGQGAVAVGTSPTNAGPAGAGGQGGQDGQRGQGGQGGQNGSAASRLGVRGLGAAGALEALSPSTSTYNQVYGREAADERRIARERRSQARGNYSESWRVSRAAIENYTPSVRIGNTTSLRTAHSPFAEYLTGMHRRIHRLFADGFIPGLDSLPGNSPLNDRTLVTTLEIVLEADGRIARLGVVRTSGMTPFDVGALNAVRRSAPFGAAPQAMLSGDGRAYMHWAFHRDERYCLPLEVEPYMVPAPGGETPAPSQPAPRRQQPTEQPNAHAPGAMLPQATPLASND